MIENLVKQPLVKCWLAVHLHQAEFDSVQVVEAQATPDQASTVKSQNQKIKQPLHLQERREFGADVLVATDPDADRVGVEVLQRW